MSKNNKVFLCSCYKPVSLNENDVLDPTTVKINDELNKTLYNENLFNKKTGSESNECDFLSCFYNFFNLITCYKKEKHISFE